MQERTRAYSVEGAPCGNFFCALPKDFVPPSLKIPILKKKLNIFLYIKKPNFFYTYYLGFIWFRFIK